MGVGEKERRRGDFQRLKRVSAELGQREAPPPSRLTVTHTHPFFLAKYNLLLAMLGLSLPGASLAGKSSSFSASPALRYSPTSCIRTTCRFLGLLRIDERRTQAPCPRDCREMGGRGELGAGEGRVRWGKSREHTVRESRSFSPPPPTEVSLSAREVNMVSVDGWWFVREGVSPALGRNGVGEVRRSLKFGTRQE